MPRNTQRPNKKIEQIELSSSPLGPIARQQKYYVYTTYIIPFNLKPTINYSSHISATGPSAGEKNSLPTNLTKNHLYSEFKVNRSINTIFSNISIPGPPLGEENSLLFWFKITRTSSM